MVDDNDFGFSYGEIEATTRGGEDQCADCSDGSPVFVVTCANDNREVRSYICEDCVERYEHKEHCNVAPISTR